MRGSLWRYRSWGHSFLCVWQSHFAKGPDPKCVGLILFTTTERVGKKNTKHLHSVNNWTAGHLMQPQAPGLVPWLLSGSAGSAKKKFPASPTTCPVLPLWALFEGIIKMLQDLLHSFPLGLYHSLSESQHLSRIGFICKNSLDVSACARCSSPAPGTNARRCPHPCVPFDTLTGIWKAPVLQMASLPRSKVGMP